MQKRQKDFYRIMSHLLHSENLNFGINQILQEQFHLKRPLERTTIQKQQQNFFATVTSSLRRHLHQEEMCLASLDDVAAFLKKCPYSFHSCNIYLIRCMLTLSIYRFLKESFETFKNECNFCFHQEGLESAK